jgi:hypothetical protein
MKTMAIAAAVALACLYAVVNTVYPTYSYRYRLTIGIEIEGRVHTGSSVIEVIWRGQPDLPEAGSFSPHLRGQAVFVDLGSHGAVVASLIAPSFERSGTIQWPEGVSAIWLAQRAFGIKGAIEQLPQLPKMTGRRDLASDNLPRLIWFSHPDDPKTARRFKANEIPPLFGAGSRLAAAYVEITSDPVIVDIDKKLSWLEQLRRPLSQGIIQLEYGFALGKTMFFGDES